MVDVNKMRNEFLKLLEDSKYDWQVRIRDKQDDVGPLTIRYASEFLTINISEVIVGSYSVSDALRLFENFNATRNVLAREAYELWKDRISRFVFRRRVTARDLITHVGVHKKGPLLYALAMARAGFYEPLRAFWIVPPTLQQQSQCFNLPRVDKPGMPDRVFALQIERA